MSNKDIHEQRQSPAQGTENLKQIGAVAVANHFCLAKAP